MPVLPAPLVKDGRNSTYTWQEFTRCSLVWLKAPALGAGDREFESHFPDQQQCDCGVMVATGDLKSPVLYVPVRVRPVAPIGASDDSHTRSISF